MTFRFLFITILALAVTAASCSAPSEGEVSSRPLKVWFDAPAPFTEEPNYQNWQRWSLAIGNGFSGANIFGFVCRERIQISEESLWTGGFVAQGGVGTYSHSDPDNRQATFDPAVEDYAAIGLMGRFRQVYDSRHFLAARDAALGTYPGQVMPPDNQTINDLMLPMFPTHREALGRFQNFSEVYFHFRHEGRVITAEETSDYIRWLDIREAIAGVSYNYAGVNYRREMFASHPDRVIVKKISASEAGKVEFTLNPTIPHTTWTGTNVYGKTNLSVVADAAAGTIKLQGMLRQNGLRFAAKFQVITDGTITAGVIDGDGTLIVSDATNAIVILAHGTDYVNDFTARFRTGIDPMTTVSERLSAAVGKGFDRLRSDHIADYQSIFNLASLDLGGEHQDIPTDRLLAAYRADDTPMPVRRSLEELFFQFGRYLLISSSRDGTLPANLQGVWNQQERPMWQSGYHLNINLQMNYWPANNTNMRATLGAFIDFVESLRKPGRQVAHNVFGVGDGSRGEPQGWVANLSTNVFGFTGKYNRLQNDQASGHPHYSPEVVAWLMQNIYNVYQFYPCKQLLADRLYPIMKEAALFFSHPNVLVEDPVSGRLVMSPTYSSEHGPMWGGATFQQQLLWQLFTDVVEAATILGIDADFAAKLLAKRERLHPVPKAPVSGMDLDGNDAPGIREWFWETAYYYSAAGPIPGTEPNHRHVSHIVGLHPGNLITRDTPEWMDWAKNSLNRRGDFATGWSRGHKMNLWARTGNGNRAFSIFEGLIRDATFENMWGFHTGPFFQVDGSLGGTAGMAELLLQSHTGYLQPLPALPDAWQSGKVSGLTARGGFVVDMAWEDGLLTGMTITSSAGKKCSLRYGEADRITITTASGRRRPIPVEIDEKTQTVSFATVKGETYIVSIRRN